MLSVVQMPLIVSNRLFITKVFFLYTFACSAAAKSNKVKKLKSLKVIDINSDENVIRKNNSL